MRTLLNFNKMGEVTFSNTFWKKQKFFILEKKKQLDPVDYKSSIWQSQDFYGVHFYLKDTEQKNALLSAVTARLEIFLYALGAESN